MKHLINYQLYEYKGYLIQNTSTNVSYKYIITNKAYIVVDVANTLTEAQTKINKLTK